jgi:hypothetical protein
MNINQSLVLSPSLGFTFNWYSYTTNNITSLTNNGCLSFSTWFLCPYAAKYYTSGSVFYRSATGDDLRQISKSIMQTYSSSFTATNAFIVTYHNAVDASGHANTFQAVLVTDGTHSYVIYNFGVCQTINARSFVQNGTSSFILWDNTVFIGSGSGAGAGGSYSLYSSPYIYDYLTYGNIFI